MGSPFIELQSVDSTNNYARTLIHEGMAQHGLAVFAHEQLAGRGQWGRQWSGEKDRNIALSLLVKPPSPALNKQFELSACTALSLVDFFDRYAKDHVKIKWPNDLYWQDRKAGGVLIESIVRTQSDPPGGSEANNPGGRWEWAIIGVGININQVAFSPELPNPVSLKQITGMEYDTIALAKEICRYFGQRFEKLVSSGFDSHLQAYTGSLYGLHQKRKFRKDNRVFEATITGVSPTGKLILRHALEEEFEFGDLEWVW